MMFINRIPARMTASAMAALFASVVFVGCSQKTVDSPNAPAAPTAVPAPPALTPTGAPQPTKPSADDGKSPPSPNPAAANPSSRLAAPEFVVSPPEISPFDAAAKADAPAPPSELAAPANAIDLGAFVHAIEADSEQAKAKYGEKPVVVKGKISELDEWSGKLLARLKSSNQKDELKCYLAGKPETLWGKYAVGESLVVEGTPEYRDSSATLKECRVLAQSPSPALRLSAAKLVRCCYVGIESFTGGRIDHPVIVHGEVVISKVSKDDPRRLLVLKGIGNANVSCAIREDLADDAPQPTSLPKVGEEATVFGDRAQLSDGVVEVHEARLAPQAGEPPDAGEHAAPLACTAPQLSDALAREQTALVDRLLRRDVELSGVVERIEPHKKLPNLQVVYLRTLNGNFADVELLVDDPNRLAKFYWGQSLKVRGPLMPTSGIVGALDVDFKIVEAAPRTPEVEARLDLIREEPKIIEQLNKLGASVSADSKDGRPTYLKFEYDAKTNDGHLKPEVLALVRKLVRLKSVTLDNAENILLDLGDLPDVEDVSLEGEFSDASTAHFPAMQWLRALRLDGSLSARGTARCANLHQLRELSVIGSRAHRVAFDDEAMAQFRNCRRLKQILCNSLPITGKSLSFVKDCPALTDVHLLSCPIDDAGIEQLAKSPTITTLTFSGCKFTDHGLQALDNCRSLGVLHIGEAPISGTGFGNMQNLKKLRVLGLDSCPITDDGLAAISALTDVIELNLLKTKLTSAGLPALGKMAKLERLNLSGVPLTAADLKIIAAMPALSELKIEEIKISDDMLPALQTAPALDQLSLKGCELTDADFAKLKPWPKLRFLNLTKTKITDKTLDLLAVNCQKLTLCELLDCDGVTEAGAKRLKTALPNCSVVEPYRFLK